MIKMYIDKIFYIVYNTIHTIYIYIYHIIYNT